jgi:ADP-heptose:LPS heptosyltransferase
VDRVLERLRPRSRVAVVRLRSLGDCVLTTPALEILKQSRPDLRVAVAVEDRFRAVFEGNQDIEVILPPDAGALRRWRPELCINLHGGTRSAWMTALSGARFRAAFAHFRHAFVYNVRIPRAQEILGEERKVHTAEHLASAMFYLGAPEREIPRAKLAAGAWTLRNALPANCATIHPVAAAAEKTWTREGFLAVARHLRSCGIEPVFIGAAADDLSAFAGYLAVKGASLSDIKALLARSSLFVGNDSGPAHMAAAFGIPVVVIFGASDPAIWGPWRTPFEVVTSPGGIAAITASQVIDALSRLRVHA